MSKDEMPRDAGSMVYEEKFNQTRIEDNPGAI